jgi:transcription antitermination factor NusG
MFMQKNWYVVYTRPQSEKKVASLLTKKKIENFVPLVTTETQKLRKNKTGIKPLFKSYVFVHVTEQEAALIPNVDGVINLLFWLGKPAVIADAEVKAIKEFTSDYQNVELQRLPVNSNIQESSLYHSSYEIEGNIVAVKNKTIKISLPTLGYAMIAILNEESVFGLDRSMSQNYTFAQS